MDSTKFHANLWLLAFLPRQLPAAYARILSSQSGNCLRTTTALEQFAQLAVQSVEQIHKKMLPRDAKKALAIDAVMELYKTHPQLKEPSRAALEIVIEAACLWLPKRDTPKPNG